MMKLVIAVFGFTIAGMFALRVAHAQTSTITPTPTAGTTSVSPTPTSTAPAGAPRTGHGGM